MRRLRAYQRGRVAGRERDEVGRDARSRTAKDPGIGLRAGLAALRGGELRGLASSATEALQRRLSNSLLQRLAGDGSFSVAPPTERTLESERGHGEPLEQPVRREMERAFGTSLKGVRVHADSTADALSRGISARAFTQGNDIYFAASEYQPGTREGQHILAHEMTHVIQQHDGAKLVVGPANDPAEVQAEAVAERVVKAVYSEATEPYGKVLHRQLDEEQEEGEELLMVRRQPLEEEEEELQPVRRQPLEEEEEELQPVRRQSPRRRGGGTQGD